MEERLTNTSEKDLTLVKNHFSNEAVEFDNIYTGNKPKLSGFLDRLLRKDMFDRFNLTLSECLPVAGRSIIDIGCGSGRYSIALAQKGASYVLGIDFAESMLKIARSLAREKGLDNICEFRSEDFMSSDSARKFDIALAIGVFDYIRQPQTFISKFCAVANDTVIATFPKKWVWRAPLRKIRLAFKKCPVYFYEKKKIQQLFDKTGFKIKRLERIGYIYFVRADRV